MSDPRVVRAQALFARGDLRTAADVLAPLVKPPVRDFDAAYLMARIRVALNQTATALEMFDVATALKPNSADAWLDRGRALYDMRRLDDALVSFRNAADADPKRADAHYSCGTLCTVLERHDEALAHYQAALDVQPDDVKLLSNHAASLYALHRYDEAIASFDRALALDPGNQTLKLNRAAVEYNKAADLLAAGKFTAGFAAYEHRREAGVVNSRDWSRGRPQWRGEALAGPLHVWTEMGVGEDVLFSGLLPAAHARAPRIVMECDARLAPVLQRSFPFLERVIPSSEASIEAEAQCALTSLPFALGLSHVEPRAAYLKPDASRASAIRERYAALANGRPIVGIAWHSKNPRLGIAKSSRLSDWGALLRQPFLFVNLQYGDVANEVAAAEQAFKCTIVSDQEVDQMSDLDAFTAQVAALDHVVTVSNTTAHIAGALGQPTLVLAPPERTLLWYWGEGDATSWYASVRIVAHDPAGGWAEHVSRAADLLA